MQNKSKLIILCATQRCGSTMIVDDFRSTGVLGKPEEYFIPWTIGKIEDPLKSFDSIKNKSQTENGVSVIKVMADQLAYIEKQLEGVFDTDHKNEKLYSRCKLLFKDAIFIRIDRIDSVAQATSRYIAKLTGKNHLIDFNSEYIPGNAIHSNAKYNEKIEFDANSIDYHVINIAKEKAIWSKVMDEWNIDFSFSLSYEDCINDRTYLVDILDALNLEVTKINERKIKKIGNEKNSEIINNYIESETPQKETSLSGNDINKIRDIAYRILESESELASPLLRLVLKLRPNSPRVRDVLEKLRN